MAHPGEPAATDDRPEKAAAVPVHGMGRTDLTMPTPRAPRRLAIALAAAALALAACATGTVTPTETIRPVATPHPTTPPLPVVGQPFTPGTAARPRVVNLEADDYLNFLPGLVQAGVGETVTFRIHNIGKADHEFMLGRLGDAFADLEGTAEVAGIGPGETGELTFTFDGTGPFAFACHEPGHFENGMVGYIQLVGPGAPEIGTRENPRVVWLNTDDSLSFMPESIKVTRGESIRFVVTNSGSIVHEFQVGPADKVAADAVDGVVVVEQDELDVGSTHAIDYTFEGSGPYGFACHEPGHYEAGMKGTIELVGG